MKGRKHESVAVEKRKQTRPTNVMSRAAKEATIRADSDRVDSFVAGMQKERQEEFESAAFEAAEALAEYSELKSQSKARAAAKKLRRAHPPAKSSSLELNAEDGPSEGIPTVQVGSSRISIARICTGGKPPGRGKVTVSLEILDVEVRFPKLPILFVSFNI